MAPPKDDLIIRLDARHDDLLKRIAELDRRTNAVLAQWTCHEQEEKNNSQEAQTVANV